MAKFPEADTIDFVAPLTIVTRYSTVVSQLPGGTEKRRAKFTYPLYDLQVKYDTLSLATARTLWQFYKDRYGALQSFYFYNPATDSYEGEYCGTGNGSALTFDIPGKNTSSQSVYVNGVLKTEGVHYNIETGSGAEGADRIVFTAGNAPASGNVVTVDFTGNYRYKVRFAEDKYTFSQFYRALVSVGIALVGVR